MKKISRSKNNLEDDIGGKIIKYASIGVGILTIIVVGLLIYSKNLNDETQKGTLSSEELASIANKTSENNESSESASTEMGKTVNEAKNELENTQQNTANPTNMSNTTNAANTANTSNSTNTTGNANKTTTNKNEKREQTQNTSKNAEKSNSSQETKNTTQTSSENNTKSNIELNFAKPVEGEIVKEFAKENLIFSQTLQEWTVHTGIDIKADKTTVVKAAESGTVKSIKNDPRYGLTIVVSHENGLETVYANLLSSEFVVEGEKVEKGQSLGTVGNTAAFEIADEPHLHFEILKDSIQVDPSIYLK